MTEASNKRQEERRLFTVTFDLTYAIVIEERLRCKSGFGISTNISDGGIGFLTNEPFGEGQEIKLFNSRIDESPRAAQVRWCVKLSDSLFKIGACFN